MVYHVVSKTLRGQFLLAPKEGVDKLCAGVVGVAQENFPGVNLHACVFLSNHVHLMVSAESSAAFSGFVGFIKREISRRLGQRYRLPGTFWHQRFTATALPTARAEEKCLRYILAHGVKEDLVEHPKHWPGFHCATNLAAGTAAAGVWFDATGYYKAREAALKRRDTRGVGKAKFYQTKEVVFSPLPSWRDLDAAVRRSRVEAMMCEIVTTARARRQQSGTKVLGRKKVMATPLATVKVAPPPPWWQKRRRQLTAWAKKGHSSTREYLSAYFGFQDDFARAVEDFRREGILQTAWPPSACCPPLPCA